MKDSMSTNTKEVRGSTLMTETGLTIDEIMGIDEQIKELEEAHYFHTINALVELMIEYGFDTVMDDVLVKLGDLRK